jgi:hypothetical protein
VFTPNFESRAFDDFNAVNTVGDSINSPGKLFGVGSGSTVLIDGKLEDEWHGTLGKPLVWKTNSAGEIKTGNNVGFEAYQHYFVTQV